MAETTRFHQATRWHAIYAAAWIGVRLMSQRRPAHVGHFARLAALACGLVVLACLSLGVGLLTALRADETRYAAPMASSRLLACIKPPDGDPAQPCHTPGPGGPSTTLLGTCPASGSAPSIGAGFGAGQNTGTGSNTQAASCGLLSILANTYASYGVLAWGGLLILWVLWAAVEAASPVSGVALPVALAHVGRRFLIACYAFLVAWSLQTTFAQVETILLAAEQEPGTLPLSTTVYLFQVLVTLLVWVGVGAGLLKMLLALLHGAGAATASNPRTLASTMQRLKVIAVLILVLVLAPWLLAQVAHLLTGGSI